ncbi:hypothetical protein ACHQM5_004967 [Ranunculus cassubicifolius]
MDHRSKKAVVEGRNREYYLWSMSQENSRSRKPLLSASYFSFESMFLLLCLAASLLLLPLILPPLEDIDCLFLCNFNENPSSNLKFGDCRAKSICNSI